MRRAWIPIALAVGVAVFARWSASRDRAGRTAVTASGTAAAAPARSATGTAAPDGNAEETAEGGAPPEDRFVARPRLRDAVIRVLVQDDRGRPCTKARVSAGVVRDDVGMAGPETETDAGGRAVLEVDAAETKGVHVRVGGYARYTPANVEAGGTAELTVVMPTGARLVGSVRHALEGPLGDVVLRAAYPRGTYTDYLHATSDAEGRFVLEPVPAGTCKVTLLLGRGRGQLQDWIEVRSTGEGTIDAGTIVVGGACLRGVVWDAADKRALPGVRVSLFDPVRLTTTTDPDGRFSFEDLTAAPYDVGAGLSGYGDFACTDLSVGPDTTLDIALEPAAVLHVRVRDPEGRPVLGQVTLSASQDGRSRGWTLDLDEEGRGVLARIAPGAYGLWVGRPDLYCAPAPVTIAPGENTVDFKVQRQKWGKGVRSLAGTICDAATGKPLPGVRVCLMGRDAWSDGNGDYVLEDLWAGTHRPWLEKEGFGDVFAPAVALADGQEERRDFTMEPAVTLELHLVDGQGRGVAGEVRLSYRRLEGDRMGVNAFLVADEEGHATFRRLLPGPHRLTVSVEGIGGSELEARLAPGHNVRKVVLR